MGSSGFASKNEGDTMFGLHFLGAPPLPSLTGLDLSSVRDAPK